MPDSKIEITGSSRKIVNTFHDSEHSSNLSLPDRRKINTKFMMNEIRQNIFFYIFRVNNQSFLGCKGSKYSFCQKSIARLAFVCHSFFVSLQPKYLTEYGLVLHSANCYRCVCTDFAPTASILWYKES